MQQRYVLGIDHGGSAIKCAIFDMRGNEIAVADDCPPLYQPQPGFVERDAHEVWRTTCRLIKQAIESAQIDAQHIAALSLSGYGGGLCLVDSVGQAVCPLIVSTDTRALPQLRRLIDAGAAEHIYAITHQQPWAGQSAALLAWFRENDPATLQRACYALTIKDFLRFNLTGCPGGEVTDASNLNLIDPATRAWSPRLFTLSRLDNERRLFDYPLTNPHDIAGYITAAAAAATGLHAGTPVAAGLYDVAASTLGCGGVDPNVLCMTIGTWTMASYLDTSFAHAADSTIVTVSCLPDQFLLEQGSGTGTANLNWFLDNFLSKMHPDCTRTELYAFCDQLLEVTDPRERDGLFIPYIYASSTHPDAKGAFFDLTARHGEQALCSMVLEGIVLSAVRHAKLLQQGRERFATVRLAGGITHSAPWVQLCADMLRMPVEVMEGSQQGARGAAICAGVAAGLFQNYEDGVAAMVRPRQRYCPRQDYASHYERKFARYQQALRSLDSMCTEG